ncbi:OmpA family protein [Ehrlichia canis]|uniref:OmpA/MotB domain n=3 Tax=Ehrlichia canis TaxID=944 RepID=A0ACA6AWC2_EHRCJ|nr:OmpA family protein [Ehrlichia canis]AAZ68598.1 OmpA/MotB domain [Ehrlichia canis str. Jake]
MKHKLVFIKFILLCLILSSCKTTDHVPLVNTDHVFSNMKTIEKIYFDFGKATIGDSDKAILEKVIQKAQKDTNTNIVIVGHTDTRGTDEYNLELGEQRANAVKDFIIEHDKSLENRITVQSKGKSEPAVLVYSSNPEEAEHAHAKNRRVVITLTDNGNKTSQ